jgi:hypothetical protein
MDRNATVSFPCLTRRTAVKLFLFLERIANRVSLSLASRYSRATQTCPKQTLRLGLIDFFYQSSRPAFYGQHREYRYASGTIEFILKALIESTFAEHEPQLYRIWVDARTVPVEIPLPAEPTAIEFDYQHAVLAQVR